jgi:hypothetical protein
MIELPKTIRLARFDEISKASRANVRLQNIDNAKIVQGYTFKLRKVTNKEGKEIPFLFFSEININNSRLWDLMIALTDLLPDVASLIIGDTDSEINHCDYETKNDLMASIKQFKTELIEDPFLQWGIINNDNESLTEIFIPDSKYITFWGADIKGFKTIMAKFDLNQIDDLEFIDEYPKVRESLRLFDSSLTRTNEVIDELKKSSNTTLAQELHMY